MEFSRKQFGVVAALVAALGATPVFAGKINGVKVEPANATVGSQVKVTVDGEDEGVCGLRVEYGNGDVDVTKMQKDKDNFPRSFMKTYNTAGTYTVIAKGGRDGNAFGCVGEAKAQVVVAEAPKAAPAAPAKAGDAKAGNAKAAEGPSCPEGYKLNAKSVNKKTGAYTCVAGKGAQKPAKAADCPAAGTEYFINKTGTQLGCRVPPAAKK